MRWSICLPAGKYWIGDPGYVIPANDWNELLEETNFFSGESFSYKGRLCFASRTRDGDGEYLGSDRKRYGVDSGVLSILPLDVISFDNRPDAGNIKYFEDDFMVECNNGCFVFGTLRIQT